MEAGLHGHSLRDCETIRNAEKLKAEGSSVKKGDRK